MIDIPDYCFVDKRRGLGYVAIPKVASTSIKAALFAIDSDDPDEVHGEARRWRMSIVDARRRGIMLFTVVRNPFDRAVSMWRNRIFEPRRSTRLSRMFSPGIRFSEFCKRLQDLGPNEDLHTLPQSAILLYHGHLTVDLICRYERLDREWSFLQRNYELPDLPRHNISPSGTSCRDLYRSVERGRIKHIYSTDVRLLSYLFEG